MVEPIHHQPPGLRGGHAATDQAAQDRLVNVLRVVFGATEAQIDRADTHLAAGFLQIEDIPEAEVERALCARPFCVVDSHQTAAVQTRGPEPMIEAVKVAVPLPSLPHSSDWI